MKKEDLNTIFLAFQETRSTAQDDEMEKKLQMALILVSVILGVMCIILAVVLYFTYKRSELYAVKRVRILSRAESQTCLHDLHHVQKVRVVCHAGG